MRLAIAPATPSRSVLLLTANCSSAMILLLLPPLVRHLHHPLQTGATGRTAGPNRTNKGGHSREGESAVAATPRGKPEAAA